MTLRIAIIATLCVIFGIILSGVIITYSNRSFPNTYIDSIYVGKMNRQEILNVLQKNGWQERTNNKLTVFTYLNQSIEIDPVKAGTILSAENAAEKAVSYGKDKNIFQNLAAFLTALNHKTDINTLYKTPDESYIDFSISNLQSKLDTALGQEQYRIDEQQCKLVMIKGQGSMRLETTALKSQITEALKNGQSSTEYFTLLSSISKPDFKALHAVICTGPQDAHYSTDGTHSLIEGRVGYNFDIDEASSLWEKAANTEIVLIPLSVTYPQKMAADIENLLFHDMLGAVTTKYNNSNENRSSNVRLAASKINETVIYPGEEFSFNNTVGVRSEENGFLMAPAYAGLDDIKDEIGGGVCQVSTGVYAAALFSFLEITKHTCHMYPPNYIQLGTDATVTIPADGGRTIDLCFRNSKSCPIKIKAYCEEIEDRGDGRPLKTITVEIWGTLEDDDYMPIEFDNSYADIYDYDRVIEPAYEDREGYKIRFTHDEQEFEDDFGKGIRTATYRRVYSSDGTVVEKTVINPTYSAGYALDTYYFMGQEKTEE